MYFTQTKNIFIGFLISLLILSGCQDMAGNSKYKQKLNSVYTMPVEGYLALASKQDGSERAHFMLMAVGRALDEENMALAKEILAKVHPASVTDKDEYFILSARYYIMMDRPRDAFKQLVLVKRAQDLAPFFTIQYHELLATAYEMQHQYKEAVLQRIHLNSMINDKIFQNNNQRKLWLDLVSLNVPELTVIAAENSDNKLAGWARLALISKQDNWSKNKLITEVSNWQKMNPKHPANALLPSSLDELENVLISPPRKMAILLPLSGELSGPGHAIREGFLDAYNRDNAHDKILLKFYDTASHDAAMIYEHAIAYGADYIVGPLLKQDVLKIDSLPHPVPTVLLNEPNMSGSPNLYRFGLSPLSEARQVAIKASEHGLKNALIIAPNSAWGHDVVDAFSKQWHDEHHKVVEQFYYQNDTIMLDAMKNLLRATVTKDNQKAYRRQDFDMIFFVGYPSKAREIMPAIRYYFAGHVPVFSISSVYSGYVDPLHDNDLDGIIFCDMPYVFNHAAKPRAWPESYNSYTRLFALGMDSYSLAKQLNQLILFPALGIEDETGALYLTSNRQIVRIPAWGKFVNGRAELIGDN